MPTPRQNSVGIESYYLRQVVQGVEVEEHSSEACCTHLHLVGKVDCTAKIESGDTDVGEAVEGSGSAAVVLWGK